MVKKIKLYMIGLTILSSCSIPEKGLIEEPMYGMNASYVKHFAYSLMYNESNEQADWISYQLIESEQEPNYKRTDKFLIDTLVLTGTAVNADYLHSGYDKGHLAPAADMTWNEQAMKESFYFSNISPQLPAFNRGIWKKLEIRVREWSKKYDCLYITTGPLCDDSVQNIGKNKVSIPTHFYKTILIYNDTIQQAIGFIFPHKKCEGELFDYVVSIDSLEKMTGYDFYYVLPNSDEKKIERQYNLTYWNE